MKYMCLSIVLMLIPAGVLSFVYDKSPEKAQNEVRMGDFISVAEIKARINGNFVKVERFVSNLPAESAAKAFIDNNKAPTVMKGNAGGYGAFFKTLLPDVSPENINIYVIEKEGFVKAAGIAGTDSGSAVVIVDIPGIYKSGKINFFDDGISRPKGAKIIESVELIWGSKTVSFANTYILIAESAQTVLSGYQSLMEKDGWIIRAGASGAQQGYFLAQKNSRTVSITVNYNAKDRNYTVCVVG